MQSDLGLDHAPCRLLRRHGVYVCVRIEDAEAQGQSSPILMHVALGRGRRRPWARWAVAEQRPIARRSWKRDAPATRPAPSQNCDRLPAALLPDEHRPRTTPPPLTEARDAMALLTTSAPVNYDEQEGLYTPAQNTPPPWLMAHSCLRRLPQDVQVHLNGGGGPATRPQPQRQ